MVSKMSWQDIIKDDDPTKWMDKYIREGAEKGTEMFSTARVDKIYKEAIKWLDHTIKKVTEIKRIINSEEGEVGDEYLKEIKSLSRVAEEMVDKAFVPGDDDYDSAYDTTFDQRAHEMSEADKSGRRM